MTMDEGKPMEVDKSEQEAGEPTLITLKILPVLKERQQQHGLRHGDYQRYHGYCSRRLRRLRQCLRLPQGDRRHFKKRDITTGDLDAEKADSRFLEIPVTVIERAWACAMALKQEANTETRKRIHLVSRMKKALQFSEILVQMSKDSNRLDERTKLEVEAYASFIFASFHFEMQHWNEAMDHYKKAQGIYTQIARALGDEHPETSIYKDKASELLPSMRFCAYQTGAELNISELTAQFQSAAIQKMIAQKPKMAEVNFRGQKLVIPDEKIATLLVRIEDVDKSKDVTIETYEELLVDLRDGIQVIRDLIAKPELQSTKQKNSSLLSYLLYLRLKLTNSRTELMIKEKTQSKDLIRLTEMILHNLVEMKAIAGLENDEDFQLDVDNLSGVYKAFRCRHLADMYKGSKKWSESLLLYNQAVEYIQIAKRGNIEDQKLVKEMASVADHCKKSAIECRAQVVIEEVGDQDDEDSVLKLKRPTKPLIDRLNEFVLDESLISGEPNIADFPPDFRPVPCKPLFFDLALNHIKAPASLEAKAGLGAKKAGEGETKGITGFVKGLWVWGSK